MSTTPTTTAKRRLARLLTAIAGVGPLLFFAIASAEGALRDGYDPIAHPISALALGPRGWIQALNFALLAISFAAFAALLRCHLRDGPAGVSGPAIVGLMAAGALVSGLFPMDPLDAPPSMVGRMHELAGFLVFPPMPVALFVLARRFGRDPRWRSYRTYTAATGLLCLGLLVFFLLFVGPPGAGPRPLAQWLGLVQRLLLLPFLVWMAVVSAAARARTGDPAGFREARA